MTDELQTLNSMFPQCPYGYKYLDVDYHAERFGFNKESLDKPIEDVMRVLDGGSKKYIFKDKASDKPICFGTVEDCTGSVVSFAYSNANWAIELVMVSGEVSFECA